MTEPSRATGFLHTYGPNPMAWCQTCGRPTAILSEPNREMTRLDVLRAERSHEVECPGEDR